MVYEQALVDLKTEWMDGVRMDTEQPDLGWQFLPYCPSFRRFNLFRSPWGVSSTWYAVSIVVLVEWRRCTSLARNNSTEVTVHPLFRPLVWAVVSSSPLASWASMRTSGRFFKMLIYIGITAETGTFAETISSPFGSTLYRSSLSRSAIAPNSEDNETSRISFLVDDVLEDVNPVRPLRLPAFTTRRPLLGGDTSCKLECKA